MSTGAPSFALGLNIKKSSKKSRLNYQLINKNTPLQFAIRKLVGELEKLDLSDTERNAYISIAKNIQNLPTMNMRYIAGALYWYYKLERGNVQDLNNFQNNQSTTIVLNKIGKNSPPIRADYIQLSTYVIKIFVTVNENLQYNDIDDQDQDVTSVKEDQQIVYDNENINVE